MAIYELLDPFPVAVRSNIISLLKEIVKLLRVDVMVY